MHPGFAVTVNGSRRKIDLAVFEPGAKHLPRERASHRDLPEGAQGQRQEHLSSEITPRPTRSSCFSKT